MGNKISIKIYSHELAKELSLDVIGENIPITSISPLSKLSAYCLSFSSGSTALPNLEKSTVISSENENREHGSVIVSANPRLDFARALAWLEKCNGFEQCVSEPKIHSTVKMGSNVFMDKGVVIGSNTIIGNNVVIGKRVRIGENCVMKESCQYVLFILALL
ncbi:MAG: hypothetical protein NTU49_00960 [Gammaproteobacteria bacterium]|nr:hypothetical protein [Gammaproteobacteria bacterium]